MLLLNLLAGIPVMLACLLLQAAFVSLCLRRYADIRYKTKDTRSYFLDVGLLSMVMLLMLLATFLQTAIWAALFVVLGEFRAFDDALYYSGVNFSTLGYGDVVLTERWRLLGPLEAANGILMFGVATAVMTAAVMDVLRGARADARTGD